MTRSPLKHGLFVRRPLSNALLRLWSSLSPRSPQGIPIPPNPKRILLCNIAHFGDVVISTAVLPVIKKHFPDCEIGFLTSSASAVVLENHPLISRIHRFDHWYLHRRFGKCKAAIQNPKERGVLRGPPFKCKAALHLLRQTPYDIAIDLYSYFPNAIPLLAKSQIPIRIGYTTGGFSNLLTHPIAWNFPDRYVGHAHLHLLRPLGIDIRNESPLPSYHYKTATRGYIAIHMGSQQPLKEWDPVKWIELIRQLKARGETIVLTGKGEREGALCQLVASQTGAEDRSNQLDWFGFVQIVQEARLLISVDSVAIHLAAATETPTVGLFAGINSPQMWMPPSVHIGLMERVPCAPCFHKRGCATMACIQKITVEETLRNALKLLGTE